MTHCPNPKLPDNTDSPVFNMQIFWTKFHNRKLRVEYLWLNFVKGQCREFRLLGPKHLKYETVFRGTLITDAVFSLNRCTVHRSPFMQCICYLRVGLFGLSPFIVRRTVPSARYVICWTICFLFIFSWLLFVFFREICLFVKVYCCHLD